MSADEVTYGLHIVLRFELELALIEGDLAVADLPAAWNERTRAYLGLDVPDDAHGVLQDVHWAEGIFGYFPTYALGNVIAGQVWACVIADLPDLDERFAARRLRAAARMAGRARAPLRPALPAHRPARARGGRGLDPGPYLAYLEAKLRHQRS